MAESTSVQRWHQWADLAAIVAGVGAVGLAIWPTVPSDEGALGVEVGRAAIASVVAGLLAIGGVVLAQRGSGLARVLLIAGGLLLIATPFLFVGSMGLVPAVQVALGVLMLASAPFIGRMPDAPGEPLDAGPRGRL